MDAYRVSSVQPQKRAFVDDSRPQSENTVESDVEQRESESTKNVHVRLRCECRVPITLSFGRWGLHVSLTVFGSQYWVYTA